MDVIPTLVGYVLFLLAVWHAWLDARENRPQRLLMLLTLFGFGTLVEYTGVTSGNYAYPREAFVNMGVVPLSVALAWVGIIYSVMVIAERLELPPALRILATTLIAISLDWGMDPVAVHIGAWKWGSPGPYFGVPGFNFFGWFFIPIAYLVAYGLGWDRERRRPVLLTIRGVDADPSTARKIYTLVAVVPLALGLLILCTQLAHLPVLNNLSLPALVIWAVLSVAGASALVLWRGRCLRRVRRADLIPPGILTWIGLNYAFFGLVTGRPELGVIMLVTGLPIWLSLGFTLLRGKEMNHKDTKSQSVVSVRKAK